MSKKTTEGALKKLRKRGPEPAALIAHQAEFGDEGDPDRGVEDNEERKPSPTAKDVNKKKRKLRSKQDTIGLSYYNKIGEKRW